MHLLYTHVTMRMVTHMKKEKVPRRECGWGNSRETCEVTKNRFKVKFDILEKSTAKSILILGASF